MYLSSFSFLSFPLLDSLSENRLHAMKMNNVQSIAIRHASEQSRCLCLNPSLSLSYCSYAESKQDSSPGFAMRAY